VALGSRTNTPEWRRRFELEFDSGVITGIDVPKLDLIRTRSEERRLAHLGPDLCGVYDHAEAVRRVEQAVDVPLTGAMLDQRLIAGFGNIYAVEVPFICGISPLQRVGSIEDVDSVIAVGAALIRTNARLGPQRTVGRASQSINQWVLPRERRRCPICGDALSRHSGSQSPWRRRFATCPSCQPIEETTTVNLTRVHSLLEDHPAIKMLDIERGVLTEPTDTPVEVGRRSQRSS
jgi:formamidopyrimidine-DNA glycosylase